MKVGFAQYGVAHAHAAGKASVLKSNSRVAFYGVYEPDPALMASAMQVEAYQGVHWFSTREEMLQDGRIDAVAVEGAVCDNLARAHEVVGCGKHVWLDKPAGTDWEAFSALVAAARDRDLLVQLGYMFRYNAGFQFILDWAESGRLGELFCVRGRMSTSLSQERRMELAAYQGGILFELLCHLVDIVISLLGRPVTITSFLRNELDTPSFRDNTLVVFEYPRAMAMLESAAIETSPFAARRLEVYGTRGSAILEPFEPRPALRLCLDRDRDGYKEGWQEIPVEARPRYAASLQALVADILGEKEPDRSLEHELLVQEMVLRASGVLEGKYGQ